ncbi:hypothetical protein BS47DRAFT_1344709 [Hydnum rufescens UP504]|uniref:Uncharacterized protein n=1 Tax=Hydnum rufescens UP504 TaxID=1448309 RepID=A0A9P6DVT5_9AGAM|nr:hypothetical protein BS47DRAFT_1344709 [Hydnum rufescens UP504]
MRPLSQHSASLALNMVVSCEAFIGHEDSPAHRAALNDKLEKTRACRQYLFTPCFTKRKDRTRHRLGFCT